MRAADRAIAALAERYALPQQAPSQLAALLSRLVEDPLAPTSVRAVDPALRGHLADSLSGLELEDVRNAGVIADVGSGAGLPGLVLAIALPGSRVSLVEANGRKCAFIAAAAEACGLGNVDVIHARAEAWPGGIERFELVTARALARLDVVAEYAAPLLRMGGSLVAWRGRRDAADERAAALAAAELGLEQGEILAVTPYPGARYRHLHVLRKIAVTPPNFPRRPGVATKHPLGGALAPSDRDQL
ncbi:MAG: 16S rRNA (guanine(527)-N(7))-methyltransferase RsmG [Solirubrobacteraceae bacterium]